MTRILNGLKEIFDLHEDKEQEHITIESIKKNISFKGTRLWVLIFAIFIASIGLNVNSTAVIIGAMLISPLMGPIVGTGLALGINDLTLLKRSLLNLFIATFISFLVSSFYFLITPITDAQSEILSRTKPNIYDVLIAFFGGLAGIVGSSRKDKGTLLPGVAIATALMPPLCTAGYGMATLQTKYLVGAFYLYLINCTFIAAATFLMVKYLKYESVEFRDSKIAIKVRAYMILVIIAMTLPALFFAYKSIEEINFRKKVNSFIRTNFEKNGYTIIYQKVHPKTVDLAFLHKRLKQEEVDSFQSLLPSYGLQDYYLNIKQDINQFSTGEWNKVLENLTNREERLKAIETKMNTPVPVLPDSTAMITKELKGFYSKVDTVLISALPGSMPEIAIALVYRDTNSGRFTVKEQQEIPLWLNARLRQDSVMVIFQTR